MKLSIAMLIKTYRRFLHPDKFFSKVFPYVRKQNDKNSWATRLIFTINEIEKEWMPSYDYHVSWKKDQKYNRYILKLMCYNYIKSYASHLRIVPLIF